MPVYRVATLLLVHVCNSESVVPLLLLGHMISPTYMRTVRVRWLVRFSWIVYFLHFPNFFLCFFPRCPCFFHRLSITLSRYYCCFCIIYTAPLPVMSFAETVYHDATIIVCIRTTQKSIVDVILLPLWSIRVSINT